MNKDEICVTKEDSGEDVVITSAKNLNEEVIEVSKEDIVDVSKEAEAIEEVIEAQEVNKEQKPKVEKKLDSPKVEEVNAPTAEELKSAAKQMLNNFKEYINSDKLDKKCQEQSNKTGLDKDIIKNKFVTNFLGSIGRTLHLTVKITGDVLKGAVHFINSIIDNIVNFASSTLHKLINLITLNCATK